MGSSCRKYQSTHVFSSQVRTYCHGASRFQCLQLFCLSTVNGGMGRVQRCNYAAHLHPHARKYTPFYTTVCCIVIRLTYKSIRTELRNCRIPITTISSVEGNSDCSIIHAPTSDVSSSRRIARSRVYTTSNRRASFRLNWLSGEVTRKIHPHI